MHAVQAQHLKGSKHLEVSPDVSARSAGSFLVHCRCPLIGEYLTRRSRCRRQRLVKEGSRGLQMLSRCDWACDAISSLGYLTRQILL